VQTKDIGVSLKMKVVNCSLVMVLIVKLIAKLIDK
jgi:hypothetical protein